MLKEPSSITCFWERKVGALCLEQTLEDSCFIWRGGKWWVLAYFSLLRTWQRLSWSSLLLWFTWRCCLHFPFPGNWWFEDIVHVKPMWLVWRTQRKKGLSGYCLQNPSSSTACYLQPWMPPLTLFLREVYGHPWSFIMTRSLVFHTKWLNPATFQHDRVSWIPKKTWLKPWVTASAVSLQHCPCHFITLI